MRGGGGRQMLPRAPLRAVGSSLRSAVGHHRSSVCRRWRRCYRRRLSRSRCVSRRRRLASLEGGGGCTRGRSLVCRRGRVGLRVRECLFERVCGTRYLPMRRAESADAWHAEGGRVPRPAARACRRGEGQATTLTGDCGVCTGDPPLLASDRVRTRRLALSARWIIFSIGDCGTGFALAGPGLAVGASAAFPGASTFSAASPSRLPGPALGPDGPGEELAATLSPSSPLNIAPGWWN